MPRLHYAIPLIATMTTLMFGSASAARDGAGEFSDSIVVIHHADLHPSSAKAARAVLDRIDTAALEACGASSFSLREVKISVRSSQCWKESVAKVVARINDPMIQAAYASRHRS